MKIRNKRAAADLTLFVVVLAWGVSYWLMDLAMTELSEFMLCALRFLLAFALALPLTWRRLHMTKRNLLYALLLGGLLALVYAFAAYGIARTSQSNAAFLIALSVVFTPLGASALKKRLPSARLFVFDPARQVQGGAA